RRVHLGAHRARHRAGLPGGRGPTRLDRSGRPRTIAHTRCPMAAVPSVAGPGLHRRRRSRRVGTAPLVATGGLAALLAVAYPLPTLGLLTVAIVSVTVFAFPNQALVGAFALIPFHQAVYDALTVRAHVDPGPLALWKDALLVALFARGVYDRY